MPKFNLPNIYNKAVTSQELHTGHDMKPIVQKAQNPAGRGTESEEGWVGWMLQFLAAGKYLQFCGIATETSTAAWQIGRNFYCCLTDPCMRQERQGLGENKVKEM